MFVVQFVDMEACLLHGRCIKSVLLLYVCIKTGHQRMPVIETDIL